MTTTTPDTSNSPAFDAGTGLREGYAEVGDVQLHYVEAGDGPLVVLLHGFPEFWYGWRQQIAPLVDAGFRVVAPDLRGYNLSSRPDGFSDYTADKLAGDIRGLIRALGVESAMVVGHDWGGTVAWTLAASHPEVVDRLVILNAAHPRLLNEGLRDPRQLLRTWYFFYFQFPRLPERRARRRHWRFFKRFLRDARPPYTEQESDRYVQAWSKPGGGEGDDRLLPRRGATVVQPGRAWPRLGAHAGHLGRRRSLPRSQARRATPRGRAQPRSRRAPAQRIPLGPPRRGRARQRTAHRLPRPRQREPHGRMT
jgi:pimeloyl-ACP methyl ester carboxylesterase